MIIPRHILITGASSGIGAALAELYAGPSIRLSLHGRDKGRLTRTAESVERQGATAIAKTGDVIDAEAMAAWIEECDRAQPLDLVIANAGISAGTGREGESSKQSHNIFATNVNGVLNTVQPAAALMAKRRRGQIAIISSLASFRGFPGAPSYCASKAAVRIYGEALRGELAAQGVAVNVVCPGFVTTPMTDANPFPMPLIMPPARAAQIIRDGLAYNRARIAFPWPIYALVRLVASLPQDWIAGMVARLPKKGTKS